jgi:hypothetical protein
MTQPTLPPAGVSSEIFPRINPPPVHVKKDEKVILRDHKGFKREEK